MATALYLRLSESDGDLGIDGKDESNSIENQRILLHGFVESSEEIDPEIIEYIDDGFSGTNFDRPAFKNMIEDAKKGKISTILVKDLSRLGRDYITTGDYLEQIFPLLQVRFIAVNDGYDTNQRSGSNMDFDMEVSNLINTLYSRDLSKKIKSSKYTKWKNGYSTSGIAPFGYVKDPENKGKWIIDPDAAKIVRIIFELALKGEKSSSIAAYLNKMHYPTPGLYNQTHHNWNLASSKVSESECLWDAQKVLCIIKHYEYTGAVVNGKVKRIAIGSKRTKVQPRNDWFIIEGVNEGIVTHDEFDRAQGIIHSKPKKEYKKQHSYALKGIARCGNCKLQLSYSPENRGDVFYCRHSRSTGILSNCCKDNYLVEAVDRQVLYALQKQISVILELGTKARMKVSKRINDWEKSRKDINKEIESLKEEKIRQYTAYANGLIEKEIYIRKKQELMDSITTLEKRLDEGNVVLQENNNFVDDTTEIISKAESFCNETTLTADMAQAFIEDVYIYDQGHMEIKFLYEDLIKQIVYEAGKGEMTDYKTARLQGCRL